MASCLSVTLNLKQQMLTSASEAETEGRKFSVKLESSVCSLD